MARFEDVLRGFLNGKRVCRGSEPEGNFYEVDYAEGPTIWKYTVLDDELKCDVCFGIEHLIADDWRFCEGA